MLAAAQKDSTDIIAALVEAKADPNVQDRVLIIVVELYFYLTLLFNVCRRLVGQHCRMQLR